MRGANPLQPGLIHVSSRGPRARQLSHVDTVLTNGKLLTNGVILEGGLGMDAGRIVALAKESRLPKADEKIDLNGRLVLPGVIDAHVHLRDQALAYKEDFLSGTSSAACGGVTTVLDMPNNEPLTAGSAAVLERVALAKDRALVNVGFYAAPGPSLDGLEDTAKAGIIGFKLFLSRKLGGVNVEDDDLLKGFFRETARLSIPVVVHAEDYTLLERARQEMVSAGRDDVEAYLKVHNPRAEQVAVRRALRLTEELDVKLHFAHVSLGSSLSAVYSAKTRGRRVSMEVTPQHLLLSRSLILEMGSVALADPPLRSPRTRAALWGGLTSGLVDSVASDHAPHTLEEKNHQDIWQVRTGFPGLDTLLPLLLTEVNSGRLTLQRLATLTSSGPARIFGLTHRGTLKLGSWADLVVVDVRKESVIDPTRFRSKAHFSPFRCKRVRGLPTMTFVNGVKIMDEQEITASPGTGSIVRGPFAPQGFRG